MNTIVNGMLSFFCVILSEPCSTGRMSIIEYQCASSVGQARRFSVQDHPLAQVVTCRRVVPDRVNVAVRGCELGTLRRLS